MAIQEQYILSKNPSTGTVLLPQTSNNTAFEIDNDGTNHGFYLHQDGVLVASKYGLYVYSNAVQVNSPLALFLLDNASSTQPVLEIDNDGMGHTLYIHQDRARSSSRYLLCLNDSVAQSNISSAILRIDNVAGSVHNCIEIGNDSSGMGISLTQQATNAVNKWTLAVGSSATQTNSALCWFAHDNASTTTPVVEIKNSGTGHGEYIHQEGNLASGKYILYLDNNGTPADGAGRCIRLDGCTISSSKNPESDAEAGFIGINVDGTQYAIPFYALS